MMTLLPEADWLLLYEEPFSSVMMMMMIGALVRLHVRGSCITTFLV